MSGHENVAVPPRESAGPDRAQPVDDLLGLGDELVHELGGGTELVDRTDTLAAREELAVTVDRRVLVAAEVAHAGLRSRRASAAGTA